MLLYKYFSDIFLLYRNIHLLMKPWFWSFKIVTIPRSIICRNFYKQWCVLVLLLDYVLMLHSICWTGIFNMLNEINITSVCCVIYFIRRKLYLSELTWNQIFYAVYSSRLPGFHCIYCSDPFAILIRKISLKSMLSNVYMMPTIRKKGVLTPDVLFLWNGPI
jgi:hypothetical protein